MISENAENSFGESSLLPRWPTLTLQEENYRPLQEEEITALKGNGNQAHDWHLIFVHKDFNPQWVHNCRFEGKNYLGCYEKDFLNKKHLFPPGVHNSIIRNCVLGDNVIVRDVSLIENYWLAAGALLVDVGQITASPGSGFGHYYSSKTEPVWIEVVNEAGGRRIRPFAGMLAADAYLWMRFRHDQWFQAGLSAMTDEWLSHLPHMGYVGIGAQVTHVRVIRDVFIGDYCRIEATNKLENLTLLSSDVEPTFVGEGVLLQHAIIGYANHIEGGVKAGYVVTGRNVNLKHGARIFHTYVGDNSTISCCEVLHSLIFPFHEQHHNNSFLIAAMVAGQSNIAAGVTIGSNHNSRAADGEIHAARGFWPGLCSDFKHNSYFAPFSLIAKGSYHAELNVHLPFALVSTGKTPQEVVVYPGYWFKHNLYALARNSWKFRRRDRRKVLFPSYEYDFLAPDSAESIWQAMLKLKQSLEAELQHTLSWQDIEFEYREIDTKVQIYLSDVLYHGKARVLKPAQAIVLYKKMLHLYGLQGLIELLAENNSLRSGTMDWQVEIAKLSSTAPEEWINLGGMIVSKTKWLEWSDGIRERRIKTWKDLHQEYKAWTNEYPRLRSQHGAQMLFRLHGINDDGINGDLVKEWLNTGIEICDVLKQWVTASRTKDFTQPMRKMAYDNEEEMFAVLGRPQENEFIIEFHGKMEQLQKRMKALIRNLGS